MDQKVFFFLNLSVLMQNHEIKIFESNTNFDDYPFKIKNTLKDKESTCISIFINIYCTGSRICNNEIALKLIVAYFMWYSHETCITLQDIKKQFSPKWFLVMSTVLASHVLQR